MDMGYGSAPDPPFEHRFNPERHESHQGQQGSNCKGSREGVVVVENLDMQSIVLVRPMMCPDTTATAPNSPIARPLHRRTPYSNPHLMLGSVTRRKVCQPFAPRIIAASSWLVPWLSISGISSRATNGSVTNNVASAIPGTAQMMLIQCAASHPPNSPWSPNNRT